MAQQPNFRYGASQTSTDRKQQDSARRKDGDDGMSDFGSALDSLPDVEAAGEVIDIPADFDETPEGPVLVNAFRGVPLDTVDVKDT